MKRRLFTLLLLTFGTASAVAAAEPPRRPNIVWIIVDDMSANFSCYGETAIRTPHVDRLASEGTRFTAPSSPHRCVLLAARP